jgi:large-conductance mechanosensitive channel
MGLAVGVIIGSAFQGVVTSLTDNLLSPIIGLFAKQNFDSRLNCDTIMFSPQFRAPAMLLLSTVRL